PAVGRHLVRRDEIRSLLRVGGKARPSLDFLEDEVQHLGNELGEVRYVGIPVPVVGGAEQQPGVVVEDHITHVVDGAHTLGRPVAPWVGELGAQPFSTARLQLQDRGHFADLALAPAYTAGAFDGNSGGSRVRHDWRPFYGPRLQRAG